MTMPKNKTAYWKSKTPGEKVWATFIYTDALATGETISNAVVSVSLKQGTDATPNTVLDGAAQPSADRVMQKLANGVDQCVYLVRCLATTSTGRVLELAGQLTVEAID